MGMSSDSIIALSGMELSTILSFLNRGVSYLVSKSLVPADCHYNDNRGLVC